MVVGLDFDNTIVGYDSLILDEAVQRGLVLSDTVLEKKEIRDRVRLRPDGEVEWQKIQGKVYGPRMHEAVLFDGVRNFLGRCVSQGVETFIVSHKTEFANYDPTGTPLREVALKWIRDHGLFGRDSPLSKDRVYFAATRKEKVRLIEKIGCTHFVDDLEEVFSESTFPVNVKKILFGPSHDTLSSQDVCVARSWTEAGRIVFGGG